jgi:FkbM family methyltransferase
MKLSIESSEPTDDYIINQTLNEYNGIARFLAGAKVLDIGAHIGCFSVMALSLEATQVISIEPIPISAEHLRKNLQSAKDRSIVIEAAVVGGNEEIVTLRWLNTTWRARPPKDSRTQWRGRNYQFTTAKTVRFKELLELYEPNVIKMDCEGAEYDMLQSIDTMPECVNTFTAEWHKFTTDAYDRYIECIDRLRTWGFTTDKEVRTGPKAFNLWGFVRPIAWRREKC